jgi:hypothetical protein
MEPIVEGDLEIAITLPDSTWREVLRYMPFSSYRHLEANLLQEASGQEDPEVMIALPQSTWVAVLNYLAIGAYRDVVAIIQKIQIQSASQLRAHHLRLRLVGSDPAAAIHQPSEAKVVN